MPQQISRGRAVKLIAPAGHLITAVLLHVRLPDTSMFVCLRYLLLEGLRIMAWAMPLRQRRAAVAVNPVAGASLNQPEELFSLSRSC